MADDDITAAPAYDEAAAPPSEAFGAAPGAQSTSGKAIGSLVCGILSLLIAGVLLGAVAIGLGLTARKEIAANPSLKGEGMALAGIVTGAVGAVLMVVFLALGVGFGS